MPQLKTTFALRICSISTVSSWEKFIIKCIPFKYYVSMYTTQRSCVTCFKYYFKNECDGFIRFPHVRKHLKPRGYRPNGFTLFECLETWWNPKHEFFKWPLQRNNTKLCSTIFFPPFPLQCLVCGICYIQSAFIVFLSFCF